MWRSFHGPIKLWMTHYILRSVTCVLHYLLHHLPHLKSIPVLLNSAQSAKNDEQQLYACAFSMMETVGRQTTMHIKSRFKKNAEYKRLERKRTTHAQDIGGTVLTWRSCAEQLCTWVTTGTQGRFGQYCSNGCSVCLGVFWYLYLWMTSSRLPKPYSVGTITGAPTPQYVCFRTTCFTPDCDGWCWSGT